MSKSLPAVQRIAPHYSLGNVVQLQTRRAIEMRERDTVFLDQSLPIMGQGVVSLKLKAKSSFRIVLTADKETTVGNAIVLEVREDGACFRNANNDEPKSILKSSSGNKYGFDLGEMDTYWISLDSQNRRLCYGKGYAQAQLILMTWDYPEKDESSKNDHESEDKHEIDPSKQPYGWTKDLQYIAVVHNENNPKEIDYEFYPMPVVADIPPVIVSNETITIEQLAKGEVTVVENLSKGCKVLYGNVAGANIQLNTPDFPNFTDAINYSILTEGCVCYNLLKGKEGEFGKKNPRGTYLRITLGQNLGNSPGIPYVLEIWPGQNYSPIHNHSGADAVIKVLHGQIQSRWFASLDPRFMEYYDKFDLYASDVTWLSPDYYQTHQLFNPAPKGNMCATLQCYRYPNKDKEHYEYFDYLYKDDLDGQWKINQFYPNSDMDFIEFKEKVQEEWEKAISNSYSVTHIR